MTAPAAVDAPAGLDVDVPDDDRNGLGRLLAAWREDIDSVPFPTFRGLVA